MGNFLRKSNLSGLGRICTLKQVPRQRRQRCLARARPKRRRRGRLATPCQGRRAPAAPCQLSGRGEQIQPRPPMFFGAPSPPRLLCSRCWASTSPPSLPPRLAAERRFAQGRPPATGGWGAAPLGGDTDPPALSPLPGSKAPPALLLRKGAHKHLSLPLSLQNTDI